MSVNTGNLEDVGLYTISQLAERTGVPKPTLTRWVKSKRLATVKIDGAHRTTVHMVKLTAEEIAKEPRGNPRAWQLESADRDERVAELVTA